MQLTAYALPRLAEGGYVTKTLVRVMKLTAILLLTCCLHVTAKVSSQTITYSARNVSLHQVFEEVEKQTGLLVIYNYQLIKEANVVSVDARAIALEKFLNDVLASQGLDFVLKKGNIFITTKKDIASVEDILNHPPITVRGRVVNEKGEPVNASIIIKGKNRGVTTDADGNFELTNVDELAQLIISGINIETQTIAVNGRNTFTISATTKINAEEEVIINGGYYKVEDRKRTGNISRVEAKDIERQPVTSPLMALQGRMAGVDVAPTTGMPGTFTTIKIRGTNSISSSNYPLYVIDGIPIDSRPVVTNSFSSRMVGLGFDPLSTIHPSNIESIEVLKDADATAIYGSRGGNGVVLITTKRAKAGTMRVDINAYQGVGKVSKKADLLNTQQYLQMRREAFANDGIVPQYYEWDLFWDSTRSNDWQKELLGGTANITDASLTLAGGTAQTSYRMGVGYHRETLVTPGNFGYQRFNGNINLTHTSVNRRFSTDFTASYGSDVNDQFDDQSGLVNAATSLPPHAPALYDSTGALNWEKETFGNPLGGLKNTHLVNSDMLNVNNVVRYSILKGLEAKLNLGFSDLNMMERLRYPLAAYSPGSARYFSASGNNGATRRKSWNIEPQLNYDRQLGGGKLSVLAGAAYQRARTISTADSWGGINSDILIESPNAGTGYVRERNQNTWYKYASLFARVGYDFMDRYIVNVNVRRDGSSRFGPGKQWANFGSVGAAWLFSNENFFHERVPFISFGKLRASYGTTGNDQVGDYVFYDLYQVNLQPYGPDITTSPSGLFNPDFRWELTKKLEAAIDLSVLNNRAGLSVSWYRNRTTNQVVSYPLPTTTGFTSVTDNLPATVQNSGWEFELRTTPIRRARVEWTLNANLSIPRNKLIEFPGLETSSYANSYVIGESISIIKRYIFKGVNPETGLYEVEDVDDDGVISQKDMTNVYTVGRAIFGGVNNTLRFGNLTVNFLFQFTRQNGLYPYSTSPGRSSNQESGVLNRWQKPGDVSNVQRYSSVFFGPAVQAYDNFRRSTANGESISFVRLKTASIAYQLPQGLLGTGSERTASVYLQGQNLLTVSSYNAFDPETGLSMPPLRMITLGIQLKL